MKCIPLDMPAGTQIQQASSYLKSTTMDQMQTREGETEEKAVSTSGMEGTVQRLRDLRIADRKYAALTHTMQLHSRGMIACFTHL